MDAQLPATVSFTFCWMSAESQSLSGAWVRPPAPSSSQPSTSRRFVYRDERRAPASR